MSHAADPLQPFSSTFAGDIWRGFVDSLRYDRAWHHLRENAHVRNMTFNIVALNVGLIIGSQLLYERVLGPGLIAISRLYPSSMTAAGPLTTGPYLSTALFNLLWLVPIFILCYCLSSIWYQALNRHLFPQQSTPSGSIQKTIHGYLVWFLSFVLVHISESFLPAVFSRALETLKPLHTAIYWPAWATVSLLLYLSRIWSWTLSCVLFSWYAHEPHFSATSRTMDERFYLLESDALYHIGWGAIYLILIKLCPFFIGYSLYLSLFPFAIMIAGFGDKLVSSHRKVRIPFFQTQQFIAKSIGQMLDKALTSQMNSKRKSWRF
jgi:hypothetical protein